MARKLVVEIVGDSRSLDRTFKKTTASANRFGRDMNKFGRGGFAATGAFSSLGRSVAFASGAFLGGVGLVSGIKAAFDEMSNLQKVTAQTNAVIQSTGGVAGVSAQHVEDLGKSLLNLSGVDDEAIKSAENLLLTFTNIRNVVGKNNDIFDQATKATLNLSVRFGKDLANSAVLVGKALQDPVRGLTSLQRVGVQFSKSQRETIKNLVESGHVLEAQKLILAELKLQTEGSAKAFGETLAGKLGKLRETVRNVAGSIAEQLLPAITKIVDRALAWVTNLENQRRVMKDVKQVAQVLADVFNGLRAAFHDLNVITGSTKRTLELLLATFLLFKGLKLAASLGGLAESFGLAKAGAGGLRGALVGNTGLIVAVGILSFALTTAALKATGLDNAFKKLGGTAFDTIAKFHPFGLELDPGAKFKGTDAPTSAAAAFLKRQADRLKLEGKSAREAADELIRTHARLAIHDAQVLAGVFAESGFTAGAKSATQVAFDAVIARTKALAKAAGAKRPGEVPGADRESKAERLARLARIRQAQQAARDAVVERAAFAVERATATKTLTDDLAALANLQALLRRRIAGGHKTLELEKQLFDVQQQIADVLKQQAEARAAQRDARQFKLLGLGPTGEDLVPGVKALKSQLRSVTDAIEGTFLDTGKTRNRLGGIRKVLADGVHHVSNDVRATIQRLLADLKAQLKQSSVDVTKFQQSARGQFTLAGATPGGREAVVINGPVHFHGVQNVKEMENALLKRKKQRAHARRSTR